MNKKNRKRLRRTVLGYKQYLVLKTIDELEKKGEPVYFSKLANELKGKVVWGYIVSVIDMFEKRGLLETESKGRLRFVKLTDRGREALRLAERLIEIMNFDPED